MATKEITPGAAPLPEAPSSRQSSARGQSSSFVSNVLKLVSGSVSAQVLSLATAPILARLFAPEAFGAAAIFVSITGIISALVGLRYELSIVLPEKDEEASNVAAVSCCFILLTTALTALFIALATDPLLRLLHAPELHAYRWLIPPMVLFNGISAALGYWNTRKKHFGRQTVAQIAGAIFFAAAQLGCGFAGYISGGTIITTTVLSALVSTLTLGIYTWRDYGTLYFQQTKLRLMYAALKRYSSFPKYSTASAVLNNLGWQIPTFFLSAFFTPAVVGHYSLGNKLLRIPISLLGLNIATVFFQHASEANHIGELRHSVDKMFSYLVSIFAFPSLMLILIGKDLFVVAFGARWAEAGIYTEILSIYVLFWFLAVPLGIVLNVLERQALELRFIAAGLLVRIAALWLGGRFAGPRVTLTLFAAAGTLVYGYYCFVVLRRCAIPFAAVAQPFIRNLLAFAPAGLLLLALKLFDVHAVITLTVAAIILGLYYWNLVRKEPSAREALSGLLRKLIPPTVSSQTLGNA